MMMNNNKHHLEPTNGCKRCTCCPYGLHVDSEFVKYCETVIRKVQSPSSNNHHQHFHHQRVGSFRETHSLPRHRSHNYMRSHSFNLQCDCNHNTTASSSSSLASEHSLAYYSRSLSLPRDDSSLDEVVQKFEEVLRDQRRKMQRRNRRKPPQTLPVNSVYDNVAMLHFDSPPASPASEFSITEVVSPKTNDSETSINKTTEKIEDNANALQVLRQKIAALRDKRRSQQNLSNGVSNNNVIDQEKTDAFTTSSLSFNSSVSNASVGVCNTSEIGLQVNLKPETFSVSTCQQTIDVEDKNVSTSPLNLTISILKGVSLPSTPVHTTKPKNKSIGISTNLTDNDEACSLQTGNKLIKSPTRDIAIQTAVVNLTCKSTETLQTTSKNEGVSCDYKSFCDSQGSQTIIEYCDESVQVEEKCCNCSAKQDEVKNGSFSLDVVEVLPSECNQESTVNADDEFPEKESLSKITVRPLSLPTSPKQNRSNKIIFEENNDEILIYPNPDRLRDGSSSAGKHRAHLPQMMARREGELEMVCKIESDSGSDSDVSDFEDTNVVSRANIRKNIENMEPSREMRAALKVFNDSLQKPDLATRSATIKSAEIIETEWFKISSGTNSSSEVVEAYLDVFESVSKQLLNHIVNMADASGNTAMHYAVSHSNFDVASVLLDSKVCDVNKQNKVGYSPVMLVTLSKVSTETEKAVTRRLFQLSDVNLRAKQNGQTALMLAASHGQITTCALLIECGAALNVQDNDGSTALMCASEHGRFEVVRLLLTQPECDSNIADNDGATALSIAMESGNKDIGLALYASSNMMSRGTAPYSSLRRTQSKAIAATLRRTNSFNTRSRNTNTQLATSPAQSLKLRPSPPK